MPSDKDGLYDSLYAEYYQEALAKPMEWFKMDADFMRDRKVRRLAAKGGWEYIGKLVVLYSCLAAEGGHIYDVSTDEDVCFMLSDMTSPGCEMEESELVSFLDLLARLGLIDPEMYGESKVCSDRMIRNAEVFANQSAMAKAKAQTMRSRRKN